MLALNRLLFILCFFQTVYCQEASRKGPTFVIEPPNRVEFSNSSGTVIPCSADGRPPPLISWVNQDGEVISDLPGLRHVRHDGSLAFPPFPGEEYRADLHAGLYRCVAANGVGTVGSRDVHVRAVVIQRYEIRVFDEFVLRGNMAVLRCPVPSFVSDYVRVTSWERVDGFLITPGIISGKYGMLENGDLYVRDTTEHDSTYSFRCHAENVVTKEKKVSMNYSRIIVTEPHHSQPPRITRRSSKVVASVGQRATLACVAQGYPVPTYRWQRVVGDQLMLPDLASAKRQEGGVLVFHKVVPTDSGRYTCVVSNSMGEDKVDIELVVEEPLRVTVSPQEVRVDVGKTATLNCTIAGSPVGSVVWKKDMRFLSSNSRILFPTPTVLQLRQAKRQDAGMYQCFIHSDTQSAQASARLLIGDLAPKFKVTFSEKIVRPGSYVSLMCVSSGNPPPQIKWALDGIWPLVTRPGILVSAYLSGIGDVISFVNITSVDVSDSGVYSCEARNDAGSVQHSRRLNVFGPLLVRPLNNLSALAGDSFTVLCPFGGYPFDVVHWKRDGRLLPLNQRQRVFPNGSLVITDVQPGQDDGRYSCEVTSGQGMPASRAFRIIIRTGPKVSPFAFQDNLHEGMRTAVTCIVVAGDGPLSTRWLKDGRPLVEGDLDASVLYGEGGFVSTLTIKTLAYRHNGNYTCLATNDVATGSYSAMLTVKVPPRWMLEPSDTSAVAGRPAKIDCQADGVPQPHVRWKVATGHPPDQFKTIVSSSHVHILVNGSLNFRNVESSDSGFYLCEANNGVGTGLSTVVRLTVHSAPQFQSKFLVLSARRGERTVIDCSSRGDRPMAFSWRRNGVLLDPAVEPRYAQTIEEMQEGDKAKLIIDKVERRDSSLFTCTAQNDFGEDTMNIQLTVQDTPDAPQNLEVHDVGSRSLRLTWNRPFDGNSPITQYTVVWRQVEDQLAGGPQTVVGTETSMTIRGLQPVMRYFFRVKGENSLGESEFSAEVAVTTLEEPPRKPPRLVKAVPVSSRSVNVTWQSPSDDDGIGKVDGYYVGYKVQSSPDPYTFKAVDLSEGLQQNCEVLGLNRFTEYSIVVQAFNNRGAGPPSEEVAVRTLEFDRPGIPKIITYFPTSMTIKLTWELSSLPSAPVSGYVLHHRMEGSRWLETHLTGDRTVFTLHELQCGTTYYFYLVAFNSAGRGESSEVMSAKTDGNSPIAPEKELLLTVNSTSVTLHLNTWHNGGCPIAFFVVQYKARGQQEWTLVSNNIIPEQQDIIITDLSPGTWYSLLMTARNDAGATDAEYLFATFTLSGEHPPRPSEVTDVSGAFYRHLTITVPVVSSAMVLIVVLCVVCLITRRRTSACRPHTPDGADGSEPIKPEHMPLSVTYDSSQEPAYFPAPYATSRVPAYNREHCLPPGTGNPQNMGTFGSTRSGYTYDIPYPPRRTEKEEGNYEPPAIYFPSYHHTGVELRAHRDHAIYEVPDRGRMKHESRSWREAGDGNSSTESDNEELLYSLHSPDDRVIRDDARESETECDRLWKTFEGSQYEGNKRWAGDHAVLS